MIQLRIWRWVLIVVLTLLPGRASGQTSTSLVRFAVDTVLVSAESDDFSWVCVGVRPDPETAPRDAIGAELPAPGTPRVRMAGYSECVEDPEGAFHSSTSEPALLLTITVGEVVDDGRAWFTTETFRADLHAGKSICDVEWMGTAWNVLECRPLFISE